MQNFFPSLHFSQGLPQPSIYNPNYSNFLPLLPNFNPLSHVQSLQSNLHKRVNPYADLPMHLPAGNSEKRLHVGNPSGFQASLNLNLKNSQSPAVEMKSVKVELQKPEKLTLSETEAFKKALDADSLHLKDNILNKLLISTLGRDMVMPTATRPMEMMFHHTPNYPLGNMNQQQVFNFPIRSFTSNGFYGHQSFQPSVFPQQGNNFIPQQQFQKNPSLLNFTANHQSFVPHKTPLAKAQAQKPALIVIDDNSESDGIQEEEVEELFCSVTIDICQNDDVFEDGDEDEKEVKLRKNSDSQIECSKESSDCPTDFIESPKFTTTQIKNTNFSPIKPEGSFDHAIQTLKSTSESKKTVVVASHSHFRVKVEEAHFEEDEIVDDESDDEPWLFITPVGEEFQVSVIPDLELDIPIAQNPRRRTPKLKWNPESLTKDEIDQYYLSLSKLVRKEITNEEVALGSLKMCEMDFSKTLNLVKQNRLEYRDLFAAKPKTF